MMKVTGETPFFIKPCNFHFPMLIEKPRFSCYFLTSTGNSVGLAMKKIGIESGKKYFDWLFDGKGGQLRVWLGLKWVE